MALRRASAAVRPAPAARSARAEAELALARAAGRSASPGTRRWRGGRRAGSIAAAPPAGRPRAEAGCWRPTCALGRTRSVVAHAATASPPSWSAHRLRWNGDRRCGSHRCGRPAGRGATTRRGAGCAASGTPFGAPLAVRLHDRDVRAALAAGAGALRDALRTLRVGPRRPARVAELVRVASTCRPTWSAMACGWRSAVCRWRRSPRSDAVLFEWSERARMLASRIQPVRAPQDPQTVADLAELPGRRPAPEREAELRRRVRERAWQRRGSGEVADPVALADLQATRWARTPRWWPTSSPRSAWSRWWSLDRHGPAHDLGAALAARRPAQRAAAGPRHGRRRAARPVGRLRARPLADRLAARRDAARRLRSSPTSANGRLVLTPSGLLAGVPWTLLPGLAGRPVTVGQSRDVLAGPRRATPLRTGSAGLRRRSPRRPRRGGGRAPPRKAWPRRPVLARRRRHCGRGLRARRPGRRAPRRGARPALVGEPAVLRPRARRRHRGSATTSTSSRQVPDVVLLSACEVGRSSVRWGEELIGMTAAWLHAGARCVIASARPRSTTWPRTTPWSACTRPWPPAPTPRRRSPGRCPAVSADAPRRRSSASADLSEPFAGLEVSDESGATPHPLTPRPHPPGDGHDHVDDQPGRPRRADDRFAVISDPRPGTIVEVAPGSQLAVKFRRGLGLSRWHIVGVPGHLLVLPVSEAAATSSSSWSSAATTAPSRCGSSGATPSADMAHEVCELLVVPVSDGGARTSRPASPRTA